MDLSARQQKLLFVGIVIVLAVFGYYLVLPAVHGSPHDQAASNASKQRPAPATTTAPSPSAGSGGSAPAASTTPAAASNVNIYNLLPFTPQDLANASSVVTRFGVDYNTFTYTENAAAYVGSMSGLITTELAATLTQGYQAPGVATLRKSQKEVSTGTATIIQLRSFSPGSLTFVVGTTQHLVSSNGTSDAPAQYAVTVNGSGTDWQVNDIELASAGNT